jgi:hypothetical protein
MFVMGGAMSLSTPIAGRPIRLRKRTKAESNGRFVLYIAAGCIVLAIFQSVETLLFLRGAETVEGKILIVNSFYRHDKTGEYLAYRPIIRFKSLDGDEHETDDVTESRVPPPIGANVTVHYHRGHRVLMQNSGRHRSLCRALVPCWLPLGRRLSVVAASFQNSESH